MTLIIEELYGQCPVQAEGTIDGRPFYFRARGESWDFRVGDDPVGDPDWSYDEDYPGGEYAAGWMDHKEARACIEKAANIYMTRDKEPDDGQPSEQQEWHDFDPNC